MNARMLWTSLACLCVFAPAGCKGSDAAGGADAAAESGQAAVSAAIKVGYDLRSIKPREETLRAAFDRMRGEAAADGKRIAVLFSADWCNRCQKLEAELGNMHPADKIGDVRIFVLKEEDWEDATRLDEFNNLRRRWEPVLGTYPLFVLLDESGGLHEEMKDAIDRLTGEGLQPTVDNWFASSRASSL